MEWVWAFCGLLMGLAMGGSAASIWKTVGKWQAKGEINYGMGPIIRKNKNALAFNFNCLWHRFFAVFFGAVGVFGFVVMFGWIWKAL
ncbi:hypothetical protein [Sphingorhabdus sp.]|uniref:hypothetical protein n=1 Tax=Sphingorhabdus sp. TaxID=1902408 RepID=UPI0035939ED3